jgi:hypothetical protein
MSVKRIPSLSSPLGALIGDRSTGIGQCEEEEGVLMLFSAKLCTARFNITKTECSCADGLAEQCSSLDMHRQGWIKPRGCASR